MKYKVILHKEERGGYSVTVPALSGCFSQGATWEEAIANSREAIECHIESLKKTERRSPFNILEQADMSLQEFKALLK
jgi:predicted RNase H-like HicB family nuclease